MYTFVNKNYIIPIVFEYEDKTDAIDRIYHETICRSNEYNSNVYIVCQTENFVEFYYSDGINLYKSDNSENNQYLIEKFNNIKYMGCNYLFNDYSLKSNGNNSQLENMNLVIGDQLNNNISLNSDLNTTNKKVFFQPLDKIISENIINKEENNKVQKIEKIEKIEISETTNEYDKKKGELFKLIEQVNEMYQKEIFKIKKLELDLKTFDDKLKKLNKKKKEKIINNIIKTQSEYQTWKKIKYIVNDEIDVFKPIGELELSNKSTPILFLSKYDYINKIEENESIAKIFEEINLINLNELYSSAILPDEKIIKFCEKYVKLSKELHYHFENEWNYLENEMYINSTNRMVS
jgi:hypothetical protein